MTHRSDLSLPANRAARLLAGGPAQLASKLERANGRRVQLLSVVEHGDGAPTRVQRAAYTDEMRATEPLLRAVTPR